MREKCFMYNNILRLAKLAGLLDSSVRLNASSSRGG